MLTSVNLIYLVDVPVAGSFHLMDLAPVGSKPTISIVMRPNSSEMQPIKIKNKIMASETEDVDDEIFYLFDSRRSSQNELSLKCGGFWSL